MYLIIPGLFEEGGDITKSSSMINLSGMLGLGYSKDKFKNVIIVEEEKKIIIDIYKTYLRKDVKTYSDVSKRIVSKYGEVINGKRITESRIGLILKDEKYLGKVYRKDFEGNVYEFDIGKIIDDELWNEVLEKRNKVKIVNKNVVKKNYLLKGKVNCGCCGSNMWIKRGGKNTNGVQWSYYYCNNIFRKKRYEKKFNAYVVKENTFRKNKQVDLVEYEKMYGKFTNCSNVKSNTISVSKLEELVWVSLYDFLLLNDKIKNEYKIRFEEKLGSKDKFSGKLKYYKEKLSKEKDKKMLMYDRWLEGKVTDEDKKDYDLRNDGIVNEIKGKVKSIQSELDNINNNVSVDSYIDLMKSDIKNELNVKRFEDRKRVIDKYVRSVKVKLLNYNTKMKEYEIIIELFNDNIKHKIRLNDKLGYHLKTDLAERKGFEPSIPR
ncbi:MAG: recombinase family protein [Flavobacteriaceae bacterium]|nr:recombinase family protein [Flavobacteriaceae bacterium]